MYKTKEGEELDNELLVGVIMGKISLRKSLCLKGYIGMLAVDSQYRSQGIGNKSDHRVDLTLIFSILGTMLVKCVIRSMKAAAVDDVPFFFILVIALAMIDFRLF